MFVVFGGLLLSCIIWAYITQGARVAIAVACGCSLLFPTWVSINVGPTICNLRSLGALVAVGIILLTSCRLLPGGLMLSDLLVAALALSQIATEYSVGDLAGSTFTTMLVEWIIPYLLGRCVFESIQDLRRLTSVMAWVCVILSVLAIIECVTRVNILNLALGHIGSLQGENDIRWGLKRAEGPASHPIFFGMMLVMLLPWGLEAARLAANGQGPKWWKAVPWITGLAICSPMSRGPQIGLMICLVVTFFLRNPAWRRTFAVAALLVCVVGAVAYKPLIAALHVWANEDQQAKEIVMINGNPVEYSGTNHRMLQLTVYEKAALNAGWGGYGAMCIRVSTEPSKIPYVEEHLREKFISIDNHYLLMLLRTGYSGIGLFILLGICALCYLVRPAFALAASQSMLAGGLFASIMAVMFLVTTVFFATDFGFLWLFNIGVAASLRKSFNARFEPAIAPRVQPSLAPGHPLLLTLPGIPRSNALPS